MIFLIYQLISTCMIAVHENQIYKIAKK